MKEHLRYSLQVLSHLKFLVAVAPIAACCCSSRGTQNPSGLSAAQSSTRFDINSLIGKSRSDIEKVLGKPDKAGVDSGTGADRCQYKLAKTRGVRVLYAARGSGLPKTECTEIDVSFERGTTWQVAAKALGLDPSKLKSAQLNNIPSQFQLVGDPFKGWDVFFSDTNARYPGGSEFINDDGGLPLIQFEPRSINDPLPDTVGGDR